MSLQTDVTYEGISRQARPYPSYLLPEGGTALSLFSAGFLGWNDVIHLARAGMDVTCVDTDKERLFEMSTIYPGGWRFHVDDAWAFATRAALDGQEWDVVTVDPFFGDAQTQALHDLGLWTTIATKLVTLTVRASHDPDKIEGWKSSLFPRSSKASWLVMSRA